MPSRSLPGTPLKQLASPSKRSIDPFAGASVAEYTRKKHLAQRGSAYVDVPTSADVLKKKQLTALAKQVASHIMQYVKGAQRSSPSTKKHRA